MSVADTWQTSAYDDIVTARVGIPHRPDGTIERTALVERLRAVVAPCVLITAGPGYGKSTLAAQWSQRDDRDVAWLTLDASDNDEVVLARHLIAALEPLRPVVELVDMLRVPAPPIESIVVPALARLLLEGHPFLLVLDDVHEVTSLASLRALKQIIDATPPGCQTALVGRSAPPIRLPREMVADRAVEIGQDELAYSNAEAIEVLAAAVPTLPPTTIDAVISWTEGWPAGIQLVALALGGRRDGGLSEALEGLPDRRLADYFHDEYLDKLDANVREFLVTVSVLDRFDVALCDAVLDRTDSEYMLELLAASGNTFVIQSPDRSFHVHQVLADILRAELRRRDPVFKRELRRRASAELSARGDADAAVAQARATGDSRFTAQAIFREVDRVLFRGESATLGRWLSHFSPDEQQRSVELAVAKGWLAFVVLDIIEMGFWIDTADGLVARAAADGHDVRRFQAAVAAMRMMAGVGGLDRCAQSAAEVEASGAELTSWAPIAPLFRAAYQFAMDEEADVLPAFTRAEVSTRGAPAAHVNANMHLAIVHLLRKDVHAAQSALGAAFDEAATHQLLEYPPLANMHGARALLCAMQREQRDRDMVDFLERQLNGALLPPRGLILGRLLLAEAALTDGDLREASRHLASARRQLATEPSAVRFESWATRLASRIQHFDGIAVPLTGAERRVLELLDTHHSLAVIADQLYVSRNTVKTHLHAVYRKLGVTSRADAVTRARDLGLLDG